MALANKEYIRVDPGHKDEPINVVFVNIATFAEYRPKELKGKAMPGHAIICMNNGQVLLVKAEVKSIKQIMETVR